jgi:hypothetical protein
MQWSIEKGQRTKEQTMVRKNTTQKQSITQHETHERSGLNSRMERYLTAHHITYATDKLLFY